VKSLYFPAGILSFLTVQILFFKEIEPVTTYFFVFVWWSYILLVDSFMFWKKGNSFISRLKGKTFLVILASFFFWIFFEILNRRISNWHYSGPSLSFAEMAVFGTLAFGSVIPGILETYELLQSVGLGRRLNFLGWEKSSKLLKWKNWGRPRFVWIFTGTAMLAISLVYPRYFFWIIWVSLIFILDPIVEKSGGNSIFAELREGNIRNFYRLLLTGLVCGALWEYWNYWAGLKWIYEVPFVGEWKIFEMPVLGYLGFTFFAVECYVFYQWFGCYFLNKNHRFGEA
jgi:hypothetical protein